MPDQIVNLEQEKIEKQEKEKEVKESVPWLSRLPPKVILIAIVIDLLILAYMNASKMKLVTWWYFVGATILILWFMSRNPFNTKPKVLSPREARIAINKRIDELYLEGTPLRVKYNLLPWYQLMHSDVMPLNYIWAVIISDGSKKEYGVAVCSAVGDTQGFTWFDNLDVPYDSQTHYPNKIMVMDALTKYILKQPGIGMSNILGINKRQTL